MWRILLQKVLLVHIWAHGLLLLCVGFVDAHELGLPRLLTLLLWV